MSLMFRHRRSRPFTAFMLVMLALPVALVSHATESGNRITPASGPNDPAEYRYLTLENGMAVLLVSNPQADKAAAALDINVGSGDDTDERPGLAHFTEHMLFLGTETYPDPGEYHQFISDHGGSHNAYTAFQDTNYFFDVDPEHLEPALDRFSSQFLAPTFAEDLIERERRAVHSEFTAKIREDGRRFWSALQASINPEHRMSRFAVGNMTTLSNDDNELRQDVIDFYNDRYSANIMALVVVGPQSLDSLESMVVPRFSGVANHDHEAHVHDEPFFTEGMLPRLLEVEALRDTRRLQLTFPIPSTEKGYATKPVSYLAHLIGHEGPGSLHDVLRGAGLVDELSAGQGMDTGQEGLLSISMSLTPEGLERWEDITSLTFDYIDQIREQGISRDYFDEQARMRALDLEFQEQQRPISQANQLARRMHRVEPEDTVIAPWLYEEYDPEAYHDILERLVPDNLHVSILAPFDTDDSWEQTQWYGTDFRISDLDGSTLIHREGTSDLTATLLLPDPNPFIPEDLSLVAGDTMDQPVLLRDGPIALWYARDTRFGAPRGNLYLSLRSPVANDSPRTNVLTRLMVETVNDELNNIAYAARVADLDYRVYDHLRGITVQISGYNDKMPELMDEILLRLRHPVPRPDRFELHRQRLMEELGNALKQRPHQIAVGRLSEELVDDIRGHQERLEAASDVTLKDLYQHINIFYQGLDPVMLVHGNVTHAGALSMGQQARGRLMPGVDLVSVPRSDVKRLPQTPQALSATVDHPDIGYVRYLQGNTPEVPEQALYRVMAQLLSSPFYESLRTDQQVGYIVHATQFPLLDMPALAFIIQSPEYDADDLDQRVSRFLSDFGDRIENLSSEEFERAKAAVITRLAEEETQLRQVAQRYWQEIDRKNTAFDTRERMISAVRDLDQETLQERFRSDLLEQPRQLAVDAGREQVMDADGLQPIRFEGDAD